MRHLELVMSVGVWKHRGAAFTRTDLVVALLLVGLLSVVLYSFAYRPWQKRSRLEQCKRNLKEITLGFVLWVNDNDQNYMPWATGDNRRLNRESRDALRHEAWFQFASISNQLETTKALTDPSDRRPELRAATSWGTEANGGLSHPDFRNRACSYGLQLDFTAAAVGLTHLPLGRNPIVVLDRHLPHPEKSKCSETDVRNGVTYKAGSAFSWTREIHGSELGNVAHMDGSVDTVSVAGLTNFHWLFNNGWHSAHFLFP